MRTKRSGRPRATPTAPARPARGGAVFELLVRGGVVVRPAGRARVDIGIRDGRFAEIGDLATASAAVVLDARGTHVLPGVLDTHVHFREPGDGAAETLQTGSAAALRGGVVAVFDMPNTHPATCDADALADKRRRAAGGMHCDYAFWLGARADNLAWLREAEREAAVAGVKLFMGSSTGPLLMAEDAEVAAVLAAGRRPVAVHAEDEPRLRERQGLRCPGAVASHSVWRDPEAAARAIRRLARLAQAAQRPVHVLHTSTQAELDAAAAQAGLLTLEATPHHLTLAAAEAYARLGTLAQVNPPLRDAVEQARMFRALNAGRFATIGSDHAPHTLEAKAREYPASPSGMPGVGTLLPVMLEHVAAGRLSLERLVQLTSAGPARLFGMTGKGCIIKGNDADLVLVDLAATRVIEHNCTWSKAGWTPFVGMELRGWPVATVLRGRVVMRDGVLPEPPGGAPVRFHG